MLGKRVLAKILGPAGRAIAEIVGAVVVPPGALVVGRAVQNFEMDIGMIETDPAKLHQILRLEPDRKPPMIERLVPEVTDPEAGHFKTVFVGIERADRLTKDFTDAVTAVRARGHVGPNPMMTRIEPHRMV